MKEITLSSFAKINFSIDVTGLLENGMHTVDMVMHQVDFFDDVSLRFQEDRHRPKGDISITLTTNRHYLPTDERNLAYQAAKLMIDVYGDSLPAGTLDIEIFKRIPVAAGMAGGSGNGAAVLHGLNALWKLDLSLETLCQLGSRLGSDVPFCIMGQAAANPSLPERITKDVMAASCARATGTGTEMEPLPSVEAHLVIAKPQIGVSTKEVYQGIDRCVIKDRPQNHKLVSAIRRKDSGEFYKQCINVLETYTLKAYPEVEELKAILEKDSYARKVLMSGSGPTVFAIFPTMGAAKKACIRLRNLNYEAYWTKTTNKAGEWRL